MQITTSFPGGNGLWQWDPEEKILHLQPDQRDTEPPWFYWSIALAGESPTELKVQFPDDGYLGNAGPAVSFDAWKTGSWLQADRVDHAQGCFSVPGGSEPVWLAVAPPYTLRHWQERVRTWTSDPSAQPFVPGKTGKGRPLPALDLRPRSEARHSIVLCARHHACEMQANRVIDGLIAAWLEAATPGTRWLKDNVLCRIVPFVDLDGVEAGDQGKFRTPHDHNRDYGTATRYPETALLRSTVQSLQPALLLDFHGPYLRGSQNDSVFLVGSRFPRVVEAQKRLLEAWSMARKGRLRITGEDLFPHGKEWNCSDFTPDDPLCSCATWANHTQSAKIAFTVEVGYGEIKGVHALEADYRTLGAELAEALAEYLKGD